MCIFLIFFFSYSCLSFCPQQLGLATSLPIMMSNPSDIPYHFVLFIFDIAKRTVSRLGFFQSAVFLCSVPTRVL